MEDKWRTTRLDSRTYYIIIGNKSTFTQTDKHINTNARTRTHPNRASCKRTPYSVVRSSSALQPLEHHASALQVTQRAVCQTTRLARAKLCPRGVRHALFKARIREFRDDFVEDSLTLFLLRARVGTNAMTIGLAELIFVSRRDGCATTTTTRKTQRRKDAYL